jgi:hypothetical protein
VGHGEERGHSKGKIQKAHERGIKPSAEAVARDLKRLLG